MREIEALLQLMRRLRDPQSGCPWDLEQTFSSIVPHTIEEAYEVADAIRRGDLEELKEELGDLLFQVVFYAQLAEEQSAFDFRDVAAAITDKMVRRHPHVFGETRYRDVEEQSRTWERIKQAEGEQAPAGALDGIALTLPALSRAVKLQRKAARVGFDWPALEPVLNKIHEELRELRHELDTGRAPERLMDELGDLLFASANLARHLQLDPEAAVRGTNAKFERRFRRIEQWLAERGLSPEQVSLVEMDRLWDRAKAEERNPAG